MSGAKDTSGDNYGYQGDTYNGMSGDDGTYSRWDVPQGFQRTPPPDSNFKYPYDYDEQKLSSMQVDIQNIRAAIKAQEPGTISALADYWVKVVQLLDAVGKTVSDNADALHGGNKSGFGGWSSPAATEFLRWGPGASLYSIKQWTDAANANVRGLRALSDAVLQAHRDIDDAWRSYQQEAAADKATLLQDWTYDPTKIPEGQRKQLPGPVADMISQIYEHNTAIWRKWSVKAQGIAYNLSQTYFHQMEANFASGRGSRFEGPSNAVIDDPMKANMPGAPGPGAPPPGSAPGAPPPGAPGASPPPAARTPGAAPPPSTLQELIAVASAPPPPPAPVAETPVPLPGSQPGLSPLLSPQTAVMLGLMPPPSLSSGPAGLPGGSPAGLFGKSAANALGAPESATGLKSMLSKQGVLRPSGASAQSEAPPGGMGRAALSRPGARSPNGGEPEGTPGRRGGARSGASENESRPGAPGYGEEELFGHGTSGTMAPVLGGRRTTGIPNSPAGEPPGQLGPTRPGTSPSVLKAARQGRGAPGSTGPADEVFGESFGEPGQPGTIRPVLGSPGRHRGKGAKDERLDEIPRGLRGVHTSGGTAHQQTGPSELSSRRRVAADQPWQDAPDHAAEHEDASRVVADEEAWVVATPGGPVLTSRTEQPAYQPEHRPVLGGGSS
jgi:hypothetical protein